jgi:archaemetzincin
MSGVRNIRVPIALALFALALVAHAQEPGPRADRIRARVHLVVIGRFPSGWIDPIARELEAHLHVQAVVEATPRPLPEAAYYRPRNRYRAERLLDFLTNEWSASPAEERVLGLTSRDISTTTERFEDWGILGLANMGERAAVVSSFRMRRRTTPEHALWRMTTTAVHETGHVLGLPHCPEPACIMRDANGTMDTVDAGDGQVGPECLRLLDQTAPRRFARR